MSENHLFIMTSKTLYVPVHSRNYQHRRIFVQYGDCIHVVVRCWDLLAVKKVTTLVTKPTSTFVFSNCQLPNIRLPLHR